MSAKPEIIEQFREVVWYSLDNNLLQNAHFVAERLLAYNDTNSGSKHLLALCLFRQGKCDAALRLTESVRHIGCAYVYGQCCLQLNRCKDGITALENISSYWNNTSTLYDHTDKKRRHIPDAGAVYCLLGHLSSQGGGTIRKSMEYYVSAVKANPFLWEAFDGLCKLGIKLRVRNIFRPVQGMASTDELLRNHIEEEQQNIPPDLEVLDLFNSGGKANFSTKPIFNIQSDIHISHTNENGTPGTPTFGSNPSELNRNGLGGLSFATPTEQSKPLRSRTRGTFDFSKPKVSSRLGNDQTKKLGHSDIANESSAPIRRSTRLLPNASKFTSRFTSANTANVIREREPKKMKSTAKLRINSANSDVEMKDVHSQPGERQIMTSYERAQSERFVLDLLRICGEGYYNLQRFQCVKSVEAFLKLPPSQQNTSFVLSRIGRAYFEMVNYIEADKAFKRLREIDPSRLEDMEIYSTLLWHQREDVRLSYLAHELLDTNRFAPEAWCAIGNCFSLQRDHDQALKCFQRAVQLDPRFAYAYTLQGHEYALNEEFEKAQTAFRSALRVDRWHYNAWYGLGMVSFKIGNNSSAAYHFREAEKINPTNAILSCFVGMVLERENQFAEALDQYVKACGLAPNSALCRFKKAKSCIHLHYYESALEDLIYLKDLAPDEASVHFLLGKLYKHFGNKPNAMRHFTLAQNLDPKASHLIRECIERLDEPEDEVLKPAGEVYKNLDDE
ncbi:Protein bimA [Neolecta irregularis DAH-3]|uniref:Protein bimA n=1 Tax=Neolecta irregularis (strain DAH-3) TaxID=1198029 RepID=A0A1U7LML0_NEOID|nr:Protein bimA [Neolecta irregularis DAH-3]|eukprot:OLL23906.1 Protein bimA [Neolecta irregularis DAH-3]